VSAAEEVVCDDHFDGERGSVDTDRLRLHCLDGVAVSDYLDILPGEVAMARRVGVDYSSAMDDAA